MSTHLQVLKLALEHHKRNELARAEALYREVLAGSPGYPDALGMLGQLLLQTGRGTEGIGLLRQAIAGRPREPAFHAALGQALAEAGHLDEAIEAQCKAVNLVPEMAPLHYNLGISLKKLGRLDEALASFNTAIRLQPPFEQAHNNLGNVLQSMGRIDEAIAAYEAAARLAPADPVARNNLGNALKNAGKVEAAEAAYHEAVRLKPDFAEAWSNLADLCLLAARHDEALEHGNRARRFAPSNAVIHSNYLHTLLFHPRPDACRLRTELAAWNRSFAAPLARMPHRNDRSPERCLKIGYVSPDFRNHVVGRNLIPLFKQHDRSQFEIFCYSGVERPDAITAQFAALASHTTRTAGMSDEQLAEIIHRDGIDILVDLTLHMAGNRLLTFARKPAPVQVTFAGSPVSTGLAAIDFRITDPHLDPPAEPEAAYVEQPIRIPSFWCYDPIDGAPPASALPAKQTGAVTFASLNNFCKLNDETLDLWARVMNTSPNSRLMLLAGEGPHRAKLIGFMLRRGIAPEQIRFHGKLSHAAYLELYNQIDIALDLLPVNGHSTSLDALYMGVPLVTLPGNFSLGRAGLSILTNFGLTEFIAHTPDEFVQTASTLAGDLDRLESLRAGLRQRMEQSVLMDAPRFAREIERAYRDMWRKWCESPVA